MAKKNLNIMQMVKGQLETGREVLGLIAENKVKDNKRYELTSYIIPEVAETMDEVHLTFTEILPEDADDTVIADKVNITAANAAVMRYVYNPNAKPVPEAEVTIDEETKQKYLWLNENKAVFLGTIPAVRVVATCNGEVVLGVETGNPEQLGLLRYDVQNDRFDRKPFAIVGKDAMSIVLGGHTYLIDNQISMVPQIDEDKKPVLDVDGKQLEKPMLADAAIYCYAGNGCLSRRLLSENEYSGYDIGVESPIDGITYISKRDGNGIFAIKTSYTEDFYGYLEKAEMTTFHLYQMYGFEYNLMKIMEFQVSNPNAEVFIGGQSDEVTTVFDTDRILISDEYGRHTVDDAAVVAAMSGYNYFCETEKYCNSDENEVIVYTYANKDMQVKSFSMTKTDRGTFFSVKVG